MKLVLRRFIRHDRIHAKAMYRMAVKTFGEGGGGRMCFDLMFFDIVVLEK